MVFSRDVAVVSRASCLMAPSSSADPQVPQEGLPSDTFRSSLLCPQPQTLGQVEMDCDLHSSLQVCEHLRCVVSGVGLGCFPAAGTAPAPALTEPQAHWFVSVLHSPCSSPWMPTAVECSGIARPPPAARWTRPSARRSGRARRRSGRHRGPCPAARAGGTRWPRSPPSPHAPLRVSVPWAGAWLLSRVIVRAARG